MTFYVAPDSAFPRPPGHVGPSSTGVHTHRPEDLFCFNIPWHDCEVEGELELKLRFRKK